MWMDVYVCMCVYMSIMYYVCNIHMYAHTIVGRYTQKVDLLSLPRFQVIFPLQTFVNILNFYSVRVLVSGGEEHEGVKNRVI